MNFLKSFLSRKFVFALALMMPLFFGIQVARASEPSVVVSIAPLHSLVWRIMEGVSEPILLMSPDVSPHHYRVKPSDARAVVQADLVVWIGKEFETSLVSAIQNLSKDGRIISFSRLPDLTLLEFDYFRSDREASSETEKPDDVHFRDVNMHVWLDPANAIVLANNVAAKLIEIDPARTAIYRKNRDQLIAELEDLSQVITETLAPFAGAGFVLHHNSFSYFAHRFQLGKGISLSSGAHIPQSGRRLSEQIQLAQARKIQCGFTERQYSPKLVQKAAGLLGVPVTMLDALGRAKQVGPELYFTMMQNNSQAFLSCFSKLAN